MSEAVRELFISYSREDTAFAAALMRELDAQGVAYWLDRRIDPGRLWIDEIESAVRRASVFVLLISPGFLASEYALMEAGMAVGRAQESGARIVPILLSGASLPPILRNYQALRADSMTVKDVAAQLRAVVSTIDRKPERTFKELRLFVSSAADVTAERECVARIVEELNASVGATEGVRLVRYTWETPLLLIEGGNIQAAVDEALGHVDVFLLILGSRMGTPTGHGRTSGTEEEFRMAVDKSKHAGRPLVLCYLKTAPVQVTTVDQAEQLRRVLEFRDRIRKDRLVYEFESLADLERAVRHSLTTIIVSEGRRPTNG